MTWSRPQTWIVVSLGLLVACEATENSDTTGAMEASVATGGTAGGSGGPNSASDAGATTTDGGTTSGATASQGGTMGLTPGAEAGAAPLRDAGRPTDAGSEDAYVAEAGNSADAGKAPTKQGLPPITDYAQEGPFKTTKESSKGPGGGYTIFRPEPLGADGFVHSPIVFGPGIGTSGATQYDAFLSHLASHGYVVVAINSISGGPGAAANDTAMRNALDWILMQHGMPGPYQGKLAIDRAVVMGYSIGATSSVRIADHAAVITSVAIHGHQQMSTGKPHGPVLLLTGNGSTEIPAGPQATLAAITSVPVILALYDGQRHVTVIQEQLAKAKPEFVLITAWLRYWVNGDEDAKNAFWGPSCQVCKDPKWMVTKNASWDALML